jgi:type IV pilus assembly protein PilQ
VKRGWLFALIALPAFILAQTFTRDPFQKTSVLSSTIQAKSAENISVNFDNTPLRDALNYLAQIAGMNIVMSDVVQGNISLHLQHVSCAETINTLLLAKNLIQQHVGNIIFITSANDALTDTPFTSQLILLHNAKATDIATIIQNPSANLLSKTGSVSTDLRTNSLLIQDNAEKIQILKKFIQQIDIPSKQVMIKARIVNIDDTYLRELGVKFSTVPITSTSASDGLNMDIPVATSQTGHFNMAIAKLSPTTLVDLELSALESEGHGKIISSPELVTADHMEAYIEAGEEIPYQEKTSSGATNVSFKKAVLSLKVIPDVVAPGKIRLSLTVNQDKLSPVLVNGVPAIQTREIKTQVLVHNGETLVLGGIYEQTNSQTLERIPFIGKIPGIGGLFSSKTLGSNKKELLIFVTPEVVD